MQESLAVTKPKGRLYRPGGWGLVLRTSDAGGPSLGYHTGYQPKLVAAKDLELGSQTVTRSDQISQMFPKLELTSPRDGPA